MQGNNIGIMQGRLTIPKGRGIQFFPFENWEAEFETAQKIGLQEIEFIFDYERYQENPLWTKEGVERIRQCMENTGVMVNAVCFDYFMRRPFFKKQGEEKQKTLEENEIILKKVLESMKVLGITLIEIPLVDDSSLKTVDEEADFIRFIRNMGHFMSSGIRCGLETDLPPQKFRVFLQEINMEIIGANYDSGNSSGLGYDAYEEITVLSDYIFNIHIKDREFGGTTKKLGTGSADFDKLFQALNEVKYEKSFILQAARGEDGEEEQNIRQQMEFLKDYIKG